MRRYSSSLAQDAGKAIVPTSGTALVTQASPQGGATEPAVADSVTPARRAALYARLYRAAELQMDTVECVQQTLRPAHAAQSERSVRILAAINKTLLDIAAITKPDQAGPPDETDDDPIPRDIDEFRFELARRIRNFVEARRNGTPGIPGPGESEMG